jgi:hypothetical protein
MLPPSPPVFCGERACCQLVGWTQKIGGEGWGEGAFFPAASCESSSGLTATFSPEGEKGHCIHSANSGEAPSVNLSRPTWRSSVRDAPFLIMRHAPVLIAMSFQTQTGVVLRLLNHRNQLHWRTSPSAVAAFIQALLALSPAALWWL